MATFDIPGVKVSTLLGKKLFPLEQNKGVPEPEIPSPLSGNLATIDIESVHLSANTGSLLVYMLVTTLILLLIPILSVMRPIFPKIILKAYNHVKESVMWNWTLRLMLESSLDLSFTVLVNLEYGDFIDQPFGAKANFAMSVFLFGFYLVFPFFLVFFYLHRFKDFHNKEFVDTYGTTLEGLHNLDKSVILYPISFVLRRLIFGILAVKLYGFVVGQLGVLLVVTFVQVAYLTTYNPFDEPLVGKLEIMNEFFNVAVIDTMFMLTKINSVKVRSWMSFVYVVLMGGNIFIHLTFLIISSIRQLKLDCKKKAYAKKHSIWYAAQSEEMKAKSDKFQTLKDQQNELEE